MKSASFESTAESKHISESNAEVHHGPENGIRSVRAEIKAYVAPESRSTRTRAQVGKTQERSMTKQPPQRSMRFEEAVMEILGAITEKKQPPKQPKKTQRQSRRKALLRAKR